MSQTFDSTFPIFLQNKGVSPQEYSDTISQITTLLRDTWEPLKRFRIFFFIGLVLSFALLFTGSLLLIASILIHVYARVTVALFIGGILFAMFMVGYVTSTIGMVSAWFRKRNKVAVDSKIQLQQFVETENQRYYLSKGVQFRFSVDAMYIVAGNLDTTTLFRPVLEIVIHFDDREI